LGVSIEIINDRVFTLWLSAQSQAQARSPVLASSDLDLRNAFESDFVSLIDFGIPSNTLSIDSNYITFGCSGRLCKHSLKSRKTSLLTGALVAKTSSEQIQISGKKYLPISLRGKLALVSLD
jgi:hypothetical protein